MAECKKKLLIVSQYFYPEQFRINDICAEWVKRGYDVTVVAAVPNYPQGKFYGGYGLFHKRREVLNGINIIRLPVIPRGKNPVTLALNYASFAISGFFWKMFTGLSADIVFIYQLSPVTLALPGVWYSKRKKIPCYLYVMDLWPESLEMAIGIKNKFILNLTGRLVDYIYRRCAMIFTASERMKNAVCGRGVDPCRVEFWPQYAEEFYMPVTAPTAPEILKDGVMSLIFAGNIGEAQGLGILPEASKILMGRGIPVRFYIVGDGRYKETLMRKARENGVSESFKFIPPQPATRIPELLSACDAALITLIKNKAFEATIPAKLQSCMACGSLLIVSADGETQDVVKRSGAGLCAPAESAQELSGIIEELWHIPEEKRTKMRENARKYAKEHFEKKTLLDRMDLYLNA